MANKRTFERFIEIILCKHEEKTIKDRISEFKKIFDGSEKLQSFSSNVVKTVVDKVILGGYDKDGNPEPYMLTFIFKTGFQSKIDVPNPKGRKRVNQRIKSVPVKQDKPVEAVILLTKE